MLNSLVIDFSEKKNPNHQPSKYSEYTMRSTLSFFIPIPFGFLASY